MLRVLLAAGGAFCGCLLAIPLLVLGLPFWAVGLLTRALARLIEPAFVSWNALVEFDAAFGWKPRANVSAHHVSDDVFRITTDAQGWRGSASLAESDVVFFGDSFAFGYGIDDAHFFADLTSSPRIKSIGACGYNMVQALLWMRQLSPQLAGKLVVWSIYYGNDLYENLSPDMCGYRMPFVREAHGAGGWELVTSHISPDRWFTPAGIRQPSYARKLAELCGATFLSQRAYPACEFLLREGKELCDRVGARLVVLTIPDPLQLTPGGLRFLRKRGGLDPARLDPDFPDRALHGICERLRIPFVATKRHVTIRHHNRSDCHWNQAGHRLIADLITRIYRDSLAAEQPGAERHVPRGDAESSTQMRGNERGEMATIDQ